jgi:hypothetical protein
MKINLPLIQIVFIVSAIIGEYVAWKLGPRLPRSRSIREFVHRYAFQWYDSDIDPVLGGENGSSPSGFLHRDDNSCGGYFSAAFSLSLLCPHNFTKVA